MMPYRTYFRSAKNTNGEWDIENDWNYLGEVSDWNAEFSLQYELISEFEAGEKSKMKRSLPQNRPQSVIKIGKIKK
jgi:hypothetical protein